MTIYVVLHEDRHCDLEIHLFDTLSSAIDKAKDIATGYDDSVQEPIKGWHYHASLTEEGDSVRVTEHEVQS